MCFASDYLPSISTLDLGNKSLTTSDTQPERWVVQVSYVCGESRIAHMT
jgi:hypothetical protein